MNNTNTTKITVFITVALKKALPKISGMPYFISISAYSYLSSVFIVGNTQEEDVLFPIMKYYHVFANSLQRIIMYYSVPCKQNS